MTFTLADHGDDVEKEFWSRVQGLVPRYQEFWQSYIAPLTYRTLDPGNIHLRIGPPPALRDLANAAYRGFKLLTEATATLDKAGFLADDKTCREFFENMYALTESLDLILGRLREVVTSHGGTKINDNERRFRVAGFASRWPDYERTIKAISHYRTRYSHLTPPPRYGDHIPTEGALKRYRHTSDIHKRRKAGYKLDADFVNPRDLAKQTLRDAAACLDLVIAVALHELRTLPDQGTLAANIQRTTPDDRTLANDREYWTALSGVVPRTQRPVVTRLSDIGGIQLDEV